MRNLKVRTYDMHHMLVQRDATLAPKEHAATAGSKSNRTASTILEQQIWMPFWNPDLAHHILTSWASHGKNFELGRPMLEPIFEGRIPYLKSGFGCNFGPPISLTNDSDPVGFQWGPVLEPI